MTEPNGKKKPDVDKTNTLRLVDELTKILNGQPLGDINAALWFVITDTYQSVMSCDVSDIDLAKSLIIPSMGAMCSALKKRREALNKEKETLR